MDFVVGLVIGFSIWWVLCWLYFLWLMSSEHNHDRR